LDNLFWRDLWSGTTYALTRSNTTNVPATMTASGRFVVFGGQSSGFFVWDSQTASVVYTNTLVGSQARGIWTSADGNRVFYASWGASLLYLVDRAANSTRPMGTTPSRPCAWFSGDGRYLAYATTSANAHGDTNGLADVYLYDCQTGSNVLVSQAFNPPASANGASDSPAISADGRFVAYRSAASNLVPNDANGVPDVFLWDRITGATLLLSVSRSLTSTADNRSLMPVFSSDGRMLMFESWASDLVPGDSNHASDLFAFDVYSSGAIPLLLAAIVPGASPGQGVWITWPVVAGKTYHVQFKDSLGDAAWQTLGGSVSIVGSQGYLYDLPAGASQRFYRIVAH